MPKIRKTEKELSDLAVVMAINNTRTLLGADDERMAQLLGVSNATFYTRKRKPSTMRLSELRRLVAKGMVTPDDLCEIVGMPKSRRR